MTELVGYGFVVNDLQLPEADENGQPIIDAATGGLKTVAGKLLLLVDQANGDAIRFPLSEEGRQELVRQLTGGITLPTFQVKR